MRSGLGAAETTKEAFGHIGASLAVRIAFLVIDALSQEALMQDVPAGGLVGVNDRLGVNALSDGRD